jgi:hypothetical protein
VDKHVTRSRKKDRHWEAALFTARSTRNFRNTNWIEPKTVTWLFWLPLLKSTVMWPSEQSCDHYWFDLISVPKIRSILDSKWSRLQGKHSQLFMTMHLYIYTYFKLIQCSIFYYNTIVNVQIKMFLFNKRYISMLRFFSTKLHVQYLHRDYIGYI